MLRRVFICLPLLGASWSLLAAEKVFTDGGAAIRDYDPERYAPAYNGFCASAASRGYVASMVPEAWTIRDGRLFLNYSLSVRDGWLANIAAGDRNWPELSKP